MVFVALDLGWVNDHMTQAQLPEGATLHIFDANGTILVRYPSPEMWVGRPMPDTQLVKDIRSQHEGVSAATSTDGNRNLYAFTPLSTGKESGVYVTIAIPEAVALADADRLLSRNLIAMGAVAVLALAAAWVVGDLSIVRRVNALLGVTRPPDGWRPECAHRPAFMALGKWINSRAVLTTWPRRSNSASASVRRTSRVLRRHNARAQALARIAHRLNAQLDLKSVLSAGVRGDRQRAGCAGREHSPVR